MVTTPPPAPAASADNLIDVVSCSVPVLKTLVDSLKEILVYASIRFTPAGSGGAAGGGCLKITAVNPTAVAMVHLVLEGKEFQRFDVAREMSIGVNLLKLARVIRAAAASDVLNIYLPASDPNRLCIGINREGGARTLYRMNLLDLESVSNQIDPSTFQVSLSMKSTDLQKVVRDMTVMGGDKVELKVVGTESFTISCEGDLCSRETTYANNSGCSISASDPHGICHGVFELSYLGSFTRCSALDENVQLFMSNTMPVVLCYNVANLGVIRLMLSDVIGEDAGHHHH